MGQRVSQAWPGVFERRVIKIEVYARHRQQSSAADRDALSG